MSQDPYEAYLTKAHHLFATGEVVQAGQIWQAILKKVPDHQAAREGLYKVREWLAAQQEKQSAATPPLSDTPVVETITLSGVSVAIPSADKEVMDGLVRDGCTLYDMGMLPEAMEKWQKVLEKDPNHEDAKSYLAMAERDLKAAPPAPAPPPPPPPKPAAAPYLAPPPSVENRQGLGGQEQEGTHPVPFHATSLPETRSVPSHSDPASSPSISLEEPPPPPSSALAPWPPPLATPPPVPRTKKTSPSSVPAAASSAARPLDRQPPAPFGGLDRQLPRMFRRPAVLIGIVGGLLVAYALVFWFRSYRRDAVLAEKVAAEKMSAQLPAARNITQTHLAEDVASIRKEAESHFTDDPFLSYFRAKEVIRLTPLDGPAAQLMEKSRTAMGAKTAGSASKSVDALLKSGDLEEGQRVLMAQIAQNPDDALLKERFGRLCLFLAERFAEKNRWQDVETQLRWGRALFPQDKAWGARLILMEAIKNMDDAERKRWAQLLG